MSTQLKLDFAAVDRICELCGKQISVNHKRRWNEVPLDGYNHAAHSAREGRKVWYHFWCHWLRDIDDLVRKIIEIEKSGGRPDNYIGDLHDYWGWYEVRSDGSIVVSSITSNKYTITPDKVIEYIEAS